MNSTLYEINTRVWRHRFGPNTKLLAVPDAYWKQLQALGIDYIWLMGVWQTGPNILNYALTPGLQQAYTEALPDWKKEDIIGSPYAIDRYVLHSDLGKPEDLSILKKKLNAFGLKLILDFVPNHFHAETAWLKERPDVFLEADATALEKDQETFFHVESANKRVFAHGKDPYFAAWQDTVQVDYASADTQQFMREQLLSVAAQCDGVRCDMAMLSLPKVFAQTWKETLGSRAGSIPEFWPKTIEEVKNTHPGFCFLAEVYWDLEWTLQQKGFDYTYDKKLRDRLLTLDANGVMAHLEAAPDFQQKSIRFLENHDEDRILSELGAGQAQAAAMITYCIPGLRFFYEGQWEGRRKRLPVQLGRMPLEWDTTFFRQKPARVPLSKLPGLKAVTPHEPVFYDYLLELIRQPALRDGAWKKVDLFGQSVASFQWQSTDQQIWILVNFQQQGVFLELPFTADESWRYFLLRENAPSRFRLAPFQWVVLEK